MTGTCGQLVTFIHISLIQLNIRVAGFQDPSSQFCRSWTFHSHQVSCGIMSGFLQLQLKESTLL